MIVGIDEVGRGPWAGPLVFGAVVLNGVDIDGLTDSKKLTKKKREALDGEIRRGALSFGLGWVSAEELDELGMSRACELACRRALEQITVPYSEIIIDGTVNFLKNTGKGPYVTTIKQADLLVPSVSAASILAKVARDRFMEEQDSIFPGYGFASHVGYGTKQHSEALAKLGVTPLHRQSFAPIAELLGNLHAQPDSTVATSSIHTTKNRVTIQSIATEKLRAGKEMAGREGERRSIAEADRFISIPSNLTTRGIGDASETVAAEYLQAQGYAIVERNWKTKVCEIDIVAEKDGILYFVEVKHRKTDRQGGGLAAITSKKLDQMKFAARMYAHWSKAGDADMRLTVVVTTGVRPAVQSMLVVD